MIWQLIAALFAGLGAAGIGLILRQLSGKRLPRWLIPVMGGLGILGYQIHYEYTWFDNKQTQLPASAKVVTTEESQMFWRPWTYAFPLTTAFSVVDRSNVIVQDAGEERLAEFILYRFEKQHTDQVRHQAYLLNCSAKEMVPLAGEEKQPRYTELRRLDSSNPLFETICSEA